MSDCLLPSRFSSLTDTFLLVTSPLLPPVLVLISRKILGMTYYGAKILNYPEFVDLKFGVNLQKFKLGGKMENTLVRPTSML
jgi:hypothetical protein